MIILNYAFKCDHICAYMTFPGSYFSQIFLPFRFPITEPGMHFTMLKQLLAPISFMLAS